MVFEENGEEIMYVDMHCHCHEFSEDEIKSFLDKGINLVCVSDDPLSSNHTLELSRKYHGIIPCIGVHPWEAHKYSLKNISELVEEALRNDIVCLGEVGLDKLFVPKTYEHQLVLFKYFLNIAKEYDLVLNLHTAGTWREVFDLLIKYDIDKAYFHWYTGPLNLLEQIKEQGYFIGINPAWKIQEKHRKVIEKADIDMIITESDAPYKYKNMVLSPLMVIETVNYIAERKKIDVEYVKQRIWINYNKIFKH